MTTRLEMLRAERDQIEGRDDWANPALTYLNETIEALEAEERAAAPEPTSTTEPDADPVAKLVADLERAAANPDRLSDAERDALVRRYNTAVVDAGQGAGAERIDAAAVLREMVTAGADPGALTHEQRADLVSRYNQAIRQGPERRTSEALRGELASGDLASRMRAAAELQERGELDDATADEIVAGYNAEVQEAAASVGDPDAYPPELRPIVQGFREAQEAQRAAERRDPADVAVDRFNDFVRGLKPPSLEQQLEALGGQVEPEQVPEPASQEA